MSIPVDRVPPQSIEAEQSVLGAMLIERDAVARATEILTPDAFYRDAHRRVFAAMIALFERSEAVDIITVSEELRRQGDLEAVGGVSFLNSLANAVPTAANVEHYARIVAEKAVLRRLIEATSEIARRAYEGQEDVQTLLDQAENLIFRVAERRRVRPYIVLNEILVETFEHIEFLSMNRGEVIGVPSGIRDLDKLTAGLQPSELIILAARPSQGKTALSLNMAASAALQHKIPVGFFSLEMSREQLALRLLAAEARVPGHRLRSGDLEDAQWRQLSHALGRLSEAPIYIDDTPNISVLELRAKARRMKAEHGIAFLIVDYLQLMSARGRGESRQQEISEISRSLKSLARELQVPVLALSQLSRAVEQRQDRRPQLSDLRESGAIEQDADVVLFIYQKPEHENSSLIELVVAKQRNGPTGPVELHFFKDTGRFEGVEWRRQPA